MMWLCVQESGQVVHVGGQVVHVGGQVVSKMCTNCALQVLQGWKLTWEIEFISKTVPQLSTLSVQSCVLLDHVHTQGSAQVVH